MFEMIIYILLFSLSRNNEVCKIFSQLVLKESLGLCWGPDMKKTRSTALKYFHSFQIFKVSFLKMKMYFLKNRKGHLLCTCSFQNILCYYSP